MKAEGSTKPALVFVYNADSGIFNTVADFAHKLFSPQTYQCNLCSLTYSKFGMHKSWREFLDGLQLPLEFLHADELRIRYSVKDIPLPAIFQREADKLRVLIAADSINTCQSIDELKQLVTETLAKCGRG